VTATDDDGHSRGRLCHTGNNEGNNNNNNNNINNNNGGQIGRSALPGDGNG